MAEPTTLAAFPIARTQMLLATIVALALADTAPTFVRKLTAPRTVVLAWTWR